MGEAPIMQLAPDGSLHLRHGPIEIYGMVKGQDSEPAFAHIKKIFPEILWGLSQELPILRQFLGPTPPTPHHPIAQLMVGACHPLWSYRLTPMAAVAGSVAQYLLGQLTPFQLDKILLNNGGDIALQCRGDETATIGICSDIQTQTISGRVIIGPSDNIHGIATSGYHGRSFSLGIADAVTILAKQTSIADACATIIANHVNGDYAGIIRTPAKQIQHDSDLGDLMVTRFVPPLSPQQRGEALENGMVVAQQLRDLGYIQGAYLFLQGDYRVV